MRKMNNWHRIACIVGGLIGTGAEVSLILSGEWTTVICMCMFLIPILFPVILVMGIIGKE